MVALWNEFNPELISVKDVTLSTKKIAGVIVPLLDEIKFEIGHYSLFNRPRMYTDGIELLKKLARNRYRGGVLGHEAGVVGAC